MAQDICTYKHTCICMYTHSTELTKPRWWCDTPKVLLRHLLLIFASNIECLSHIIFHGQTWQVGLILVENVYVLNGVGICLVRCVACFRANFIYPLYECKNVRAHFGTLELPLCMYTCNWISRCLNRDTYILYVICICHETTRECVWICKYVYM